MIERFESLDTPRPVVRTRPSAFLSRCSWGTWILLGVVAVGWFATGIGMAVALAAETETWYLMIVGVAMFAFMAAPGAYLMRPARPAA